MNLKNIKKDKYLKKNDAYIRKVYPAIKNNRFIYAIVIPVYNELDYFFKTLDSIQRNDRKLLKKTLIMPVINNPECIDRNSVEYINNQRLIVLLKEYIHNSKLNLYFIDCSSTNQGLKARGGVGAARKTGMDTALKFLVWENTPVICSLDADTLVKEDYLAEIDDFFKKNTKINCATVAFRHLRDGTEEECRAIKAYEIFLDYYVEMLKKANSPYAYHAVGSTIVFKAAAYIKCGGMKINTAGEDFYFLQGMRKLGEIGQITGTEVYQSSRVSDRVPFGTGKAVGDAVDGKQTLLYNPEIFILLKDFLEQVKSWITEDDFRDYTKLEQKISTETAAFLREYDFKNVWLKIVKNSFGINSINSKNNPGNKLLQCFNIWFDAFKTLKFVHFMENNYPGKFYRIHINDKGSAARWNIQNILSE